MIIIKLKFLVHRKLLFLCYFDSIELQKYIINCYSRIQNVFLLFRLQVINKSICLISLYLLLNCIANCITFYYRPNKLKNCKLIKISIYMFNLHIHIHIYNM